MGEFSHFNASGDAIMVDVSGKSETQREALATGNIYMSRECYQKIQKRDMSKGDVLGVARIAGIMATKQTSHLIPLCHNINLTKAEIEFVMNDVTSSITVHCRVKCQGKTGVEMEALTGVHVALLTIYDMCKAVDKRMHMEEIHLCQKKGGKSGDFTYA
ncbi:cyclic pyranopterin monophosphate synthase MoaC [uncultured Eubacterium sp.]|uniref:cyclic pyranopterin monophosphate synthase MoaC n=1 Tax=uncultured Eubacterium sp. TaxID=165185 RepID=UPI0026008138|nr:cyclic pyranopterin monophosphate synthase MoaC [uncultured Eubacterium sp.]MCI6536645.1 cyclic pyranopterin monophosphate synthase MoaC [Lachnospiraceae bacterium]